MYFEAVYDVKELKNAFSTMLKATEKSINRATGEALSKGVTTLKKKANETFAITQKDFGSYVQKRKDSIAIRSNPFTTVHYKFTPQKYPFADKTNDNGKNKKRTVKRKPATLEVIRGRKATLPHAFIANPDAIRGHNTMLWQRTGEGREIEPIRRTSAAQMAAKPRVYKPTSEAMQKHFIKRLEHHFERQKP